MSQVNRFGIACKTCRRRGRKCDRRLPKCLNCGLRGAECEGYVLRWVHAALHTEDSKDQPPAVPEHETTGIFNRDSWPLIKVRAVKTANVAKTVHSYFQTKPASPALPQIGGHVVRPYRATMYTTHGNFWMQQSWHSDIPIGLSSDELNDLVKYYAREISPAFNLDSIRRETTCNNKIMAMTRAIPSIRYVVAATAACHLANQLEDTHLKRRSLHLRLKATELLRTELENHPKGPDLTHLFCILLLAQLDICSGDCVEFTTHLTAASIFIKQCDISNTERSYIEQRLAWLDVMDATTNPRMPYLAINDIKRILNNFRNPLGERVWGLDVFPCPVDIFDYLTNVVVLYESQPELQSISQDLIRRATDIGNNIQQWASSNSSDNRYHLNEVWKIGVMLYAIRLFQLPDATFGTINLTTSIFFHARCIPSNSSWSYSTSWPLFQAGLLLPHNDMQTKEWLQNELNQNFKTLGCSHQRFAADMLEQVWQSESKSNFGPHALNPGMRKMILY